MKEIEDIRGDFGEFIRQKRTEQSMSQEKLADYTAERFGKHSLSRRGIGFIELGQRTPSLTSIIILAQAFGMDFEQFMKEFLKFRRKK